MINWNATKEDTKLTLEIVVRAERMGLTDKYQRMQVIMDIAACHGNGTPLRLTDLLNAADTDFIHDITGIVAHIDRNTGHMQDCFLPRFAA